MPDLPSDAQTVVNFLGLIKEAIDRHIRIHAQLAPEWLADTRIKDDWTAVRSQFPDELLIKQRILNDLQIQRAMELHGLLGINLESKMSFLKKAIDRASDLNGKESTDLATKRNVSSWLLKIVESYLSSLAKIFPGLVSVQEFTRRVELAVEAPP